MDFKTQQQEFDNVKWYDSILEGNDRCGTYVFCDKCIKTEEYPCARAKARYESGENSQNAVDKASGFTRIATVYRRWI
ncbi:MAG: hypothetical protein IJX30_01270 [Clostridia bacterium]|nr:hypothetical protein [Clostridia bacterium]